MNVMRLLLKKYKRKINKVIKGGVILSILFALMSSLFIPPFNIYADDYSSSTIIGYQIVFDDVEYINQAWKYKYHLHFTLDDSYVGYIYMSYDITYAYNISGGVQNNQTFNSPNRAYYVNGNTLDLYFYFQSYIDYQSSAISPIVGNGVSYTVGNHNLTKHSMITTIEQIYDILEDCYYSVDQLEGINNNQLTELQNIVSAVGLSNQYLQVLTNIRNWNIPFESLSFNIYALKKGYDLYDIDSSINVSYFTNYPIFHINSNSMIYRYYANPNDYRSSYTFVLLIHNNVYDTVINDYLSINDGLFSNITRINSFFDNKTWTAIKFDINNYSSTGWKELSYIYNSATEFIFVYANTTTYKNISTDFALLNGLSNNLLDNIDIIAQGTIQSNQSSSDLNNQTSSFENTSNSLYTSENAFNTDMNNKLTSIDTSFNPSTSFGSKFLSSANWVRTQFDNITSTTPFGTVLSFSMLLGLSLLIIGKVFK